MPIFSSIDAYLATADAWPIDDSAVSPPIKLIDDAAAPPIQQTHCRRGDQITT